jgi:ribonuclease HI
VAALGSDGVVEIYTDGACKPNPGPGGWGALIIYAGHRKRLHGGEATQTTNQRMELTAPIKALESLTEPSRVRLRTDSEYVCEGMSGRLAGWKSRNWRTASNKPLENEDLWRRLEAAARRHEVEWLWVKGHAGNPGNEQAHALAHHGLAEAIARATALPVGTTGHAFDYTVDPDIGPDDVADGTRLTEPVGRQIGPQASPDITGQ